jgi:hypothetical protein
MYVAGFVLVRDILIVGLYCLLSILTPALAEEPRKLAIPPATVREYLARLMFRTQTPTLATTFRDRTLTPGKRYSYYVKAIDSGGLQSESSPEQRFDAE